MNLEKEIFEITLKDIMPNRFQPREVFNDSELNELAQSIKEHGVIQPILVRKVGDKYELIAGERRFRASQLAGKETIPAIVTVMDDKETAKVALIENLQRKDLTPIEEARTYQTILKLDSMTQEELAQNLGKSQSTIANKLRLLNLDDSAQTALLNGQISERHARSLLNLPDKQEQQKMVDKIIQNRMTVRQLDEEISKITGRSIISDRTIEDNEPNMNNLDTPKQDQDKPVEQASLSMTGETIASAPTEPVSISSSAPNNVFNNLRISNDKISEPPKEENTIGGITITPKDEPLTNPTPASDITFSVPEPPLQDQPQNKEENQDIKPASNPEIVMPSPIEPAAPLETPPTPSLPENEQAPFIPPVNEQGRIVFENKKTIEKQDSINGIPLNNSTIGTNKFNNTYDIRFAINNFRQAVQNTEKFGFKVTTEEKDLENNYQITINISKNKEETGQN